NAIRKSTLVTIDKKMKVFQFREIIRKHKENHFNDIKADADQLILWKVQISTNDMNLETEIHANDVKKEFRGEELNPFKILLII
ncbi:14475_t:CDS:1, partial [Funneliformis mosseae]